MGTWRITIEGHGCHHNNDRKIDADLAAKDFVKELLIQGHEIKKAEFDLTQIDIYHNVTPLTPPVITLDNSNV